MKKNKKFMKPMNNKVFFGCSYNDKAIKKIFDSLKKKIEKDTPIHCIIIDKQEQRPAKDLWITIQEEIKNSAACFFDLTDFRPNVVLELGYALAKKDYEEIFITFNIRKSKGKKPQWSLSDISQLQSERYKNLINLEYFVRKQIEKIEFFKNYNEFVKSCNSTASPERYQEYGLKILQSIRDDGEKPNDKIKMILRGSNCQLGMITDLLKKAKLIKRKQGRNGNWII